MIQHARVATALVAGMVLLGAAPAWSSETPVKLKLDTETTVDGVGVACTGIGQSREDPRWNDYPVRVEFANTQHEYLAGAVVTVSDMKRAPVMSVSCPGAWLLMRLPGRSSYHVDAHIIGADAPSQSKLVKVPAKGQARVAFIFDLS